MTPIAESWHDRRVLVTGYTGFLGSWLAGRLVEAGARVFGLSRRAAPDPAAGGSTGGPAVEPVQADIRVPDQVRPTIASLEVDVVFHLAGQSMSGVAARDPAATFEANVGGTWALLDAIRLSGRSTGVVLASTDAVYGDSGELPYREESPTATTTPYGTSKVCAERLSRCYASTFGIPVGVARMCNVYGGRDLAFERIVPGTIRSVLRDEAPIIRSDGRPEREYLYVEDAVDAYLRLAQSLRGANGAARIFNFGSEAPVSVRSVVDAVLRVMGRTDLEPDVGGSSGDRPSRVHTSSSRASTQLGWRASTPLDSGLERTIHWYRAHADVIGQEAHA